MEFFAKFNQLSAEEILSRVNLATAADGRSYICPICGHGTNGDGIRPRIGKTEKETRWMCFGTCGQKAYSNFDVACAALGLNTADTATAVKELKEIFGLDDNNQQSPSSRGEPARDETNKKLFKVPMSAREGVKPVHADDTEPRDRTGLYDYCRRYYSLRKFVDEQGGTWRGLTYETLNAAGCLYHGDYNGYGDGVPRPSIIFPYSEKFFFVRSVVDKERRVTKNAPRELYIAAPIALDVPNFVVEGEIDSLSIKQVMPGYGVVAVGGVGNSKLLLDALDKKFGNAERKPRFVVLFDNDTAGEKDAPELVNRLRAAGYPAKISFLEGTDREKCDANDLLRRGKLFDRLVEILDSVTNELESQAATLTKPDNADVPAQIDESAADVGETFGRSIFEYFTEKFFVDVAVTSRYAERKTGFSNIDDDGKLVLVPGLYLLGGLPATGKTTFSWQLLCQLADRGETCIYCSYEMSELELFSKAIARKLFESDSSRSTRLDLTSFNIRRGRVTNLDEIQSAAKCFSSSRELDLRVAELSNEPVPVLIEKIKPLVANVTKSPVVVVDYLQILPAANDAKRESLDDSLRRLKNFQRESNSTIILISSFNRANYWQPVSFESFKETGGIEYSADCVLGLETFVTVEGNLTGENYRSARKAAITDTYKQDTRTVKLTCLKNRNGNAFDVYFDYHCKFDCFKPTDEPVDATDVTPPDDLVDVR